jgi:transposase
MISKELEAKILRLYHSEKWKIGTISTQLHVHHSAVRRVLAQSGAREAVTMKRPSMIEPFLPFVKQTLERYPRLTASRLYQMVRERGYPGGPDHFRHLIALHRPRRSAEAYQRLRTLPGEQGQVDWAHFGKICIGRAERSLVAFVMVLSYSRQIFLRFFLDQRMENFLRGHQGAFRAWGGCPRVLLYDNLKSAVLERRGDAIRFHPTLLQFAGHWRYEPRPVAVGRGNEKGRVERAIRYVRTSFFAARPWKDLDDLNAQADTWCATLAAQRRCPEDRTITVAEAFLREQPLLLPVAEDEFPTQERIEVSVGKTPYVRFDLNDYSIPHDRVRRTLVVLATPERVSIFEGNDLLTTHPRSYSRDEQIEDPSHLDALSREKRAARRHRGTDRLHHAAPATEKLLVAVGSRGQNLSVATTTLLRLLDTYGAARLQEAILQALERGSPHPRTVQLILEAPTSTPPAPPRMRVPLPDDPRVRNLVVRPHALDGYDAPVNEDQEDEDGKH